MEVQMSVRRKAKESKTEPMQPHRVGKKEKKYKKGHIVCLNCSAVYFAKRWQKAAAKEIAQIGKMEDTRYDLCTVCAEPRNVAPDGVVQITGVEVSSDLLGLIKNIVRLENNRDINKRILR